MSVDITVQLLFKGSGSTYVCHGEEDETGAGRLSGALLAGDQAIEGKCSADKAGSSVSNNLCPPPSVSISSLQRRHVREQGITHRRAVDVAGIRAHHDRNADQDAELVCNRPPEEVWDHLLRMGDAARDNADDPRQLQKRSAIIQWEEGQDPSKGRQGGPYHAYRYGCQRKGVADQVAHLEARHRSSSWP